MSKLLAVIFGLSGIMIPLLSAIFNANSSQLNYLNPLALACAMLATYFGFKVKSYTTITLGIVGLLLYLISTIDYSVL